MSPAEPPHARAPVPDRLSRGAPRAVLAALPGARAVGGCVRDALAGRPIADVDIGVPLPPDAVAPLLRAAGLRVFDTGLAHGTLTAVLDREPVEVTSLRRDVATDGRHAVVEWTTDWREDAARRDFTINAMSLDADGGLWDWFGGRADLAAGRVRFVGEPEVRLAEDYLRALRFFRFQARYGRGEPDAGALRAIAAAVPHMARLSAERVWSECKRILATEGAAGAVRLMQRTGVLAAVLPAVAPARLPGLAAAVDTGMPAEPILRLAALLPPDPALAERLAEALRLSNEERGMLRLLLAGEAPAPAPSDGWLRRWLAGLPDTAAALAAAWLAQARDGQDRTELRRRLASLARPVFPLQGRDVLALGVPPGPAVGRLLQAVRDWWLAGGCVAGTKDCMDELERRMKLGE
ncbi:CCA tRNA nucleotidyltransferase [Roseomonas sp. OT10]|uniref:CCA tRNA nucleotidyltransferase n=1 Tax=Roseomonas cutis TaxID=2897332 RepID=UPI001E4601A4|nr:CCA tRNA nucleotidyltransferase [Roseomonas sp. OT10]UFN50905.1 CCA tRNA nucleotidyltransferase [Roseomonas sp. OT10]